MFKHIDAASVRAARYNPCLAIYVTSPSDPSDASCPNCGQPTMVDYCSRCGEKRRDHADSKLSRIAAEAFAEITNLEHSKLWQTFRLLVFKPGQLTREYWSGRRKRFVGPVKLYLVLATLFLVLHYIHQPTASFDVRVFENAFDQLPVEQRKELLKPWSWQSGEPGRSPPIGFLDKLAKLGELPTSQFVQELNARWQRYISISQFAYPLVLALALKLMLRRQRLYFAEHLIFALHVLAFIFLSSALLWPFKVLVGMESLVCTILRTVVWAWMSVYLVLALRCAYAEPWFPAIIKSAILYLIYAAMLVFVFVGSLAAAIARTGRAW